MPEAHGADWQEVWDVFHQVLAADASQRTTVLEELAPVELRPGVRREVESLLAAHGEVGSFLGAPVAEVEGPLLGSWVGPYRLVRPLGAGGMGLVYLAEQEAPVRRQVALKLVHPRLLALPNASPTFDIAARFDAERQALALLRHPGIATLYDAGSTEDGAPWMAMEYVEGLPLDAYAERHDLDLEARLHLVREVCRAVGHAHGRGIVHRDLKPSNVLVTRVDGEVAVKVIDFGIAKALALPLADARTRAGQYLGTPAYASPEQRTGGPVDARADVYALVLVLRELLQPFKAPVGLRRVLEKALAVEPGKRYANAKALGRALDQAVDPGRPRRWLLAGLGIPLLMMAAWTLDLWRPDAPVEPAPESRADAPAEPAAFAEAPAAGPFQGPVLALTFDDVPDHGQLSSSEVESVNETLLNHLRAFDVPATAFVNTATLPAAGQSGIRRDLLARWLAEGHSLGNHGAGHLHLHRTDFDTYAASIDRAAATLRSGIDDSQADRSSAPLVFRPPFLATGSDATTRAQLDAHLEAQDHRLVLATVEVLDYLYADAWNRHPAERPRLETAYLEHVEARLRFAESSAQDLFGRAIPQVVMLHGYPLNAAVLGELLERLDSRGYRFVSLEEALTDPVYALPDTGLSVEGLSWLPRWAETLGRAYDFAGEPEAPEWVLGLTGS